MRHAFLAVLIFGVVLFPAVAAEYHDPAPSLSVGTRTGKERLSDKGSDEQRVDDCKVPPTQRTRARPTACPWDVRSECPIAEKRASRSDRGSLRESATSNKMRRIALL